MHQFTTDSCEGIYVPDTTIWACETTQKRCLLIPALSSLSNVTIGSVSLIFPDVNVLLKSSHISWWLLAIGGIIDM